MNMKDMIQRMTDLEDEAKQQLNEGCGDMPEAPMDRGNPVSVSVNLNASGKEHVEDLLDMMKQAGLGGAKEVQPDMMPMRTDMERLRDIVDGPKMKLPAPAESLSEEDKDKTDKILAWFEKYSRYRGANGDSLPEGWLQYQLNTGVPSDAYEDGEYEKMLAKYGEDEVDDNPDIMDEMPITNAMFSDLVKIFGGPVGEDEAEIVNDVVNKFESAKPDLEGYDNEPDEQYDDHETMIHDLSGGINRKKKAYKSAERGDNAMAVEDIAKQLYDALSEKKAKPDFLDIDDDGDTEEPMKKAAADKKKGAVSKK